uniref:Cytoplasmic linker associated protein 1a n=1 Tax=Iconisemion striatum TaxID=60296 RepID=A0A1A7XCN1_9TELE
MTAGEDKNFEDEDSVDGGRSSSSSSSKAPPGGRRTVMSSVRRPSSASSTKSTAKEAAAGAVDEEDFMKAFEDVPSVQIYSNRELEDQLTKIREVLSDDKHDWEHRVVALKKVRSLMFAGAAEYEGFPQQLRLLEAAFKLSAKDLRSQVVREACITLGHLSSLLRNKFDHGAESVMPTLLNLVPNSAKVMATSGVAAIRLILRHTHYPRLIPIITSNCTSKSVAVRRRCYEFLDLMLQEWQTNTLERHVAVLTETIKKGIHDADSEARSIARKCYWGFHDRYGLIHQARISASVNAMRVLNTGTEVEAAVADALLLGDSRNKRKPMRRRYESPGMYSDDDANSDASSACSERSYSSRNGGIPHYLRQTEDVAEVLNHCASSNWSERKEGLLGLQNLLKSQRILSRVELKRLCEIFTRMFADPHSKRVFSMFLETLVDFITVHREDLQDWLFVLLTQLLKKMGADLLGSVQAKVQKALDVTRESFPFDQQFNILMRFIVDQTQTPNLKVKVAILKYIESLARQMDPADFVNSSETRLAVSRIITWTTEPKSSDVRKAAQVVLISLFELNTPEFTMLLGALPKTFQDGATKLLHSHLKNSSNTSSNVGSPSNTIGRTPSRHTPSRTSPLTSPTNCSHGGLSPSMMEYDTENMNSEEIYSSLRGVTEAIQSFSYRSQEDLNEPVRRDGKRDDAAGREGVASSPGSDSRLGLEMVEGGRTALDNKTSLLNTPSPRSFSGPRSREFSPYGYGETICTYDKSALKEAVFDDDVEQFRDFGSDHSDLVADLLKELSNHNERSEERKGALVELLKITREDNTAVWDEHFKTILLLLLETLCDKDHTIRALALRVLKEILRNQPARFKNYAELTIMKTLEAHKDAHKEVVRAAEEAASTLAGSIHPEQCIKVLCPIVQTADYPINLAAIKMQTKVIERIAKDSLIQLLPDIIPGLLQGYDNTESSVRKASVFCLVAIYSVIGEELKPHLAQLTGSKMKLLNLYIKRAQTTNSNSSSSSDVSSHS